MQVIVLVLTILLTVAVGSKRSRPVRRSQLATTTTDYAHMNPYANEGDANQRLIHKD